MHDREVRGAQDRSATHNSANLPNYLDNLLTAFLRVFHLIYAIALPPLYYYIATPPQHYNLIPSLSPSL